jgi:hypothetical protein
MLQINNFPDGLYRLLEKLAAADGVTIEQSVVRLLYEGMYGERVIEAAWGSNPIPLDRSDRLDARTLPLANGADRAPQIPAPQAANKQGS